MKRIDELVGELLGFLPFHTSSPILTGLHEAINVPGS
jgi:hypothetical protein